MLRNNWPAKEGTAQEKICSNYFVQSCPTVGSALARTGALTALCNESEMISEKQLADGQCPRLALDGHSSAFAGQQFPAPQIASSQQVTTVTIGL